jgi:hypothetical protein
VILLYAVLDGLIQAIVTTILWLGAIVGVPAVLISDLSKEECEHVRKAALAKEPGSHAQCLATGRPDPFVIKPNPR